MTSIFFVSLYDVVVIFVKLHFYAVAAHALYCYIACILLEVLLDMQTVRCCAEDVQFTCELLFQLRIFVAAVCVLCITSDV